MARINWLIIASWAFLLTSVLLAFFFGWYQWGRLTQAEKSRGAVKNNIALQEKITQEREKDFKNVARQFATPNTPREEPDFIAQLKTLMSSSGVRDVSILRTRSVPLPNIGADKKDATKDDGKKEEKDKKPAGYSLQNMPLGVIPLSTTLTITGPYANIDFFLRKLYNYRYNTRAINVNSLQIGSADDKGQVRALMLITRFVRPPDEDANGSPLVGGVSNTGMPTNAVPPAR